MHENHLYARAIDMNMMTNILNLLEAETDIYRSLLGVLNRERDAVVDSRFEELNEASKEKENLLLQIRILEEQRIQITEKLAGMFECPTWDLTLSRLSALVEKEYAVQLDKYRTNMSVLIRDIENLNNQNRELVSHSLDLVNGSISILERLMASERIYHNTGQLQSRNYSGRVFSGEV